jgi:putative chitobiose transport system substrate-binding protein
LIVLVSIVLSACGQAAAVPTPAVIEKTVEKTVVQTQIVEVTPMPAPNPEAVIQGVEPGAEITFWTFWLSPTFDDYIKSTIARFNEAYPDVKVNWEDHQATFQDDLRNAFSAGNAPDQYFPNLWDQQVVDGTHYQFPWYQGIIVDLVNKQILTDAGLTVEDFPKTVDGLPEFCKTIKEKTGTLCDIRLTVNDLLAQMTYEGGVKVINDDGTAFTFDSPDAVAWLQMYVDMVKAGTVDRTVLVTDQDRVGLDLFTTGKAAFYNTGPNLIREVRANNPGLYGYLDVVPAPVGKSGVVGKGLMALSVKKDTKYPNASLALATFFSNPKSMLEFSKIVAIYPSTPASYDDPFFSATPVAIEDSAKPYAKDAVSKLADILPTVPHKADVNELVLQAVQSALFDGADPQTALSDAVEKANALLP